MKTATFLLDKTENNKLLINKIIRVQGRFFSMKKKDLFCHALQSTKHNVKESDHAQKVIGLKTQKKKSNARSHAH